MHRWLLRARTPVYTLGRPRPILARPTWQPPNRSLTTSRAQWRERPSDEGDPRLRELGRQISDDYATIRENYGIYAALSNTKNLILTYPVATPKNTIVLAHGLFGFAQLHLIPSFPAIQYWRGITEALTAAGCSVVTASVPPSSSIADRAAALLDNINAQVAPGATVNIIAHSMGGLDARYMVSQLQPRFQVASLVTVATPHRGSAFADYLLDEKVAPIHLPKLYKVIERTGLGTQAFDQLTQKYAQEVFNPSVPDAPSVRYFSYGASTPTPPLLSPFRQPHAVIEAVEGANDGLVSVKSSQWGEYKGTLMDVSHLDLINWTNRLRWTLRAWMGMPRTFNAVAFYLDIADMLAKEGL